MGFSYSVYLPGFGKNVWANEIKFGRYRDLVKSLYNKDDSSFIRHTNSLIEDLTPGLLNSGLNIIDKVIILVNARTISVSPDLKGTTKCTVTSNPFEYTVPLDTVFDKLSNLTYSQETIYSQLTFKHSIVKARDEEHFLEKDLDKLYIYQLASCIDSIQTPKETLDFNNLDFVTRCQIVDSLPVQATTNILKSLTQIEEKISQYKLLMIESPFANKPAVDVPLSIDAGVLREFCKMLFTEDLNNLYQLCFNLVTKVGFTGEYLENLTPAEMYLYWALHMQKEQQSADNNNSSGRNYNGAPADI